MPQVKQCSVCQTELAADVAGDLCPKCQPLYAATATAPTPPSSELATPGHRPPFAAPAPRELAQRFPNLEIVSLVGIGGMGAVYKARQPALDRMVALKILPDEAGQDAAFTERFSREARALAKLSHPNIVTVYDFGQSDGLYYFVMEFVDGCNLRDLLNQHRPSPTESFKLFSQVCDALQFAHEEGVVHRDIKPENILVDKKGRVKIADFGIAKLLGPKTTLHTLTGPWQVMGTMHYMAPEQMDTPRETDHRVDVYAAGVVLYEMLTGQLPRGNFPLPSKKTRVDARIDTIVLKALEVEPGRRYQRISEIKDAVNALADVAPQVSALALPVADRPAPPQASVFSLAQLEVQTAAKALKWAGYAHLIVALIGFGYFLFKDKSESGAVFLAVYLAMAITAVVASRKLTRLEMYGFVMLAAILVAVPLSPACFFTSPIGLWVIMTLRRHIVREGFRLRLHQSLNGPL